MKFMPIAIILVCLIITIPGMLDGKTPSVVAGIICAMCLGAAIVFALLGKRIS